MIAPEPTPSIGGPTGGPPAFHLLSKPTGATCNLDCAYCFFLSKEMLYPGSRFRMADELLETYIRQLIEAHRTPYVTVAWQGGEPTLMGVEFFQRSIQYVQRYRRPGMTVEYTIQTNGTLIDDAFAAFFKANDFLVGISIDGPPAMHDAYRVDRGEFASATSGTRRSARRRPRLGETTPARAAAAARSSTATGHDRPPTALRSFGSHSSYRQLCRCPATPSARSALVAPWAPRESSQARQTHPRRRRASWPRQ